MRPEGVARVELALAEVGAGSLIVDVGGGIGAHAEVMRAAGHDVVVLDPSPAQRSQALERDLHVVGGIAQALPFASDVFDLAYFHLSIHYGSAGDSVAEAMRVVRPGGRVWIWTFTRHYLETSFTGSWFPSVHEHDLARFPTESDIAARLRQLGAVDVGSGTVVERVERSAGEWEEAFSARFVSTLQLIDDVELERGLTRFRATYPDPNRLVVSELEFLHITAGVPR